MRGVVSLAAALSVPFAVAIDVPFPGRDRMLVITFVVIVVTLIAQGVTLPFVVRKLGLDQLGSDERRERKRRETAARLETTRAALARLNALSGEEHLPDALVQPWRLRQEQRIGQLDGGRDPDVNRIELALIVAERARLNALLREGRISDEIRRRIERELDLDEERLRRNVRGIAEDDEPEPGPARR